MTPASVVVCTRDRPERLATCLAAVTAVLRPGDELVVVDSASQTSRSVEVAEAAGARVVRLEEPGLSRARNAGVAATTRPVVAFTDDDCRPRPGWLEALTAPLDDARVGWVLGHVLGEGEGAVTSVSEAAGAPRLVGVGEDTTLLGHGANFALRRSA